MSVMREGQTFTDAGELTVIALASGVAVPSTAIRRDGNAYDPSTGSLYVVFV